MIQEVLRLVRERLEAAKRAPESMCRACAIEELEEVIEIISELSYIYGEETE